MSDRKLAWERSLAYVWLWTFQSVFRHGAYGTAPRWSVRAAWRDATIVTRVCRDIRRERAS